MMKICNKCHQEKDITDFDRHPDCKFGVSGVCKKCKNTSRKEQDRLHPERKKKWRKQSYQKNKDKAKEQYLVYHYGINLKEFEYLLQKQNNLCAICQKSETVKHQSGTPKQLSVDHDHETGKIRGLLCYNCNRGIGHLQDNVEILKSAISYLEER